MYACMLLQRKQTQEEKIKKKKGRKNGQVEIAGHAVAAAAEDDADVF